MKISENVEEGKKKKAVRRMFEYDFSFAKMIF
jgi:hypothetical protein